MTASTAPELSDSWIERMLAERAGERAPVGLDAEIAAAVRATPRPSPLFGGRLLWRPATARGRALAFAAIATLVIVALVGAAVGTGALPINRTSPSVLPTAFPAATVLPSGKPQPAPPGVAIDFSNQKWLAPHRITDTVGWMGTPTTLYRSTDGGLTWVDTRPPVHAQDHAPATVDQETAYAVAQDAAALSIAVTHDGGQSWTTATLDVGPGWIAPTLSLRSADAGTLTVFNDGTTAKLNALQVWRTVDGGATWQGPVEGLVPAPVGKIAGAANGLMWLNVGKFDNKPFDDTLWLSRDGGVTWDQGRFPTSPIAARGELQWIDAAPLVGDDGRLVLAIDGGSGVGIFSSSDGGQTWQLLATAPSGESVGPPQSDSVWVLADTTGQTFTSTTDGGLHWRTVKGAKPIRYLDTSFSSPDLGWSWHACYRNPNYPPDRGPDPLCDGNTRASIFLTTTDGGRTWLPAGQ
jgi:photosystem II stability/assembly factor-like uncharacterized protein